MISSLARHTPIARETVGQFPYGLTAALVPEAVRDSLRAYQRRTGRTAESLADLVSVSLGRYVHPRTLYRWQEEAEAATHPISLEAAIAISQVTGDYSPLKLWAAHSGHTCVRLPVHAPQDRSAIPVILKTIRECAEAVEEATRAVGDKRVSDAEMGRVIRECAEAVDQIVILRETIARIWEQGKSQK